MAEAITFVSPDGTQAEGTADVIRYSPTSRAVRATLFVIGGLLGATACIVIPILHLFTTWGLPLLGIYMAVRTMRREVVLMDVHGTCPCCGKSIQLPGGAMNEPAWQACPQCQEPLQMRVSSPGTTQPG